METKRKLAYVKPEIKIVETDAECPLPTAELPTAELPLGEDNAIGDIDSRAWND